MSALRERIQELLETTEPAWNGGRVYPLDSSWTEADYLALETNRLIELSDGCLEELPMPTQAHQLIVQFLFKLLDAFVAAHSLGRVLLAPVPVRLWNGKMREPDVMFVRAENVARQANEYLEQPDLVMEVVSPSGRRRDTETKRREYAQAGIPEYWIVDPQQARVVVLVLVEGAYREHGDFRAGSEVHSATLAGFSVAVENIFAAAA